MTEKILDNKKNGMLMMLALIGAMILSVAGIIFGAVLIENGSIFGVVLLVLGILALIFFTVCTGGLKILKPQEALVLTLFGDYVGTLKGEGFYFVNPLCTAVNPAAYTKLNQSGDVKTGVAVTTAEAAGKRMSLKIMTLSNNK